MTGPRATFFWVAILLGACSDPPAMDDSFAGNPDEPMALQLVYRTLQGTLAPCEAEAPVPIVEPPQGGRILLIGVRARNLSTRGLQLKTLLRDSCTRVIVGIESRPIRVQREPDGSVVSEAINVEAISNFANLAVCPKESLSRDLDTQPYILEGELTDDGGRTGQVAVTIRPTCSELTMDPAKTSGPAIVADCQCLCDADYVLGTTTCPIADRTESCP